MREMMGSAAAPAAKLRIRRRGCCATIRRSLPRGADRLRGFSDFRTAVLMISLPVLIAELVGGRIKERLRALQRPRPDAENDVLARRGHPRCHCKGLRHALRAARK